MPEPAFLVEGLMEKRIVQKLCPGKIVRLIGCNGRDVGMAVVAKFVEQQIRRGLHNRCYPIIVLLDREGRRETRNQLIRELTQNLNNKGFEGQFVVGIPDRCIENWILADPRCVSEYIGSEEVDYTFEGGNGKAVVEASLRDIVTYHEPTVGCDLFLKARPLVCYANSVSFRSFVDALEIECDWLAAIRQ